MKESYTKDLANRGGVGPCVGVPRGRSEALVRGHAGQLLSSEIKISLGCRRGLSRRKATPLAALSRAVSGPHGVLEPVHVCDLSMFENRESPYSPVLVDDAPPYRDRGVACRQVAGRAGNTEVVIP